jgi:hypothetical protein
MPFTDTKPELTVKASMAQPVSQPAVYANGLICVELSEPLTVYYAFRYTKNFVSYFVNINGDLIRLMGETQNSCK